VEEYDEPVGAAFLPPATQTAHSTGGLLANSAGGKNAAPTGLYDALSPAQIAIIEYLSTGEGPPPAMDEIAIESINEVALERFGDTLIEMDRDGRPRVIDEYAANWKEL